MRGGSQKWRYGAALGGVIIAMVVIVIAGYRQHGDPGYRIEPDGSANRHLLAGVFASNPSEVSWALNQGADADSLAYRLADPVRVPIAFCVRQGANPKSANLQAIFGMIVRRMHNLSAKDPAIGKSLLAEAVLLDDLASAQFLVGKGLDPNEFDRLRDATPFTMSLQQTPDKVDMLSPISSYFLDHGANASTVDSMGMTPLMHAAVYGKTAVVKALLSHRADPAYKSPGGLTALSLATKCRKPQVVAVLEKRLRQ